MPHINDLCDILIIDCAVALDKEDLVGANGEDLRQFGLNRIMGEVVVVDLVGRGGAGRFVI